MKIPLTAATGLALSFLATLAAAQPSTNQVATPFGVDMAAAGSCEKLAQRLKALDPDIKREPGKGESPDFWYFSPAEKAYPGAKNIAVQCEGGRIRLLSITVVRDAADNALNDSLKGLDSKYGAFMELDDDTGISRTFSAANTHLTLSAKKGAKSFNILYQYLGPLLDSQIELHRKNEAIRSKRINAL